MNELALFAGAGGGILGGKLLGWKTVCAVEINPFCQGLLMRRQDDRCLEPFPIWGDVSTFNGNPWLGCVDIVTGGFPCQDISAAGKGEGITGAKSILWKHMHRIIGEVRPTFVFIENSPNLRGKGLVTVLQDLAKIGYDAEWTCYSARDCGAAHTRNRIWILAHANLPRRQDGFARGAAETIPAANVQSEHFFRDDWEALEPYICRVADGVAHRVDRIKAIGNGQVPAVAAMAFLELAARING